MNTTSILTCIIPILYYIYLIYIHIYVWINNIQGLFGTRVGGNQHQQQRSVTNDSEDENEESAPHFVVKLGAGGRGGGAGGRKKWVNTDAMCI